LSKPSIPFRAIGLETGILLGDERGVGLEQAQVETISKAFGAAGHPQHVGHQGAATRAQFEQGEFLWAAHLLPEANEEKADQFAEHLADLWRRDEVASRAQWISALVIALGRVGEAQAHIGRNRHRAGGADLHVDQFGQGRGVRHARALAACSACG
jgi:hypothetical protein